MQNESISLYLSSGSSDKEYHVDLTQSGDGWIVSFRYGRRGACLSTGTKTKDPVAFDKAKKIFDALVNQKTSKGYSPSEAGTPYQDTPASDLFTGVLPQLLNPVDECELERLLKKNDWCLQEKFDGERRLVSNIDGKWFGINRKGMRVALPMLLVDAMADLPSGTILDGEIIGEVYYPFDLLQFDGDNLRSTSYQNRLDILADVVRAIDSPNVIPVASFYGERDKRHMFNLVKSRNGEGVALKLLLACHSEGRPNSGGDHLKFKFVESATLLVESQHDSKRSIHVAAFDDTGNKVLLGNVTIPPNYEIPDVGGIVEVEYLYAFKNGCLFQPVYRGKRDDQNLEDCKVSQLKYKPLSVAA